MTDEKIMATIKPDGEHWQPEIETMPREELKKLTKMICKTAGTCPANPILAVLFSSPIHRRQNLRAPRSVTYCNMCTGACEVFCFTWFVARSSHKVPPSDIYCNM